MYRGWPYVLALVLILCSSSNASDLAPYDLSQDWMKGITAQGPDGCIVAPRPTGRPLPTMPIPGPNSTSVADIIRQAWKIAPKVYMHPLEWSLLTDPAKWVNSGPVYNPTTLNVESVGPVVNASTVYDEYLYLAVMGARSFTSHVFPNGFNGSERIISTATLQGRIKGDPVDAQGYSTAKVYYTAMDYVDSQNPSASYVRGQAVIIKFHYFYPFNGCSNQVFAMNMDGKYQGLEYYMCDPGVHEGDWEHMSFLVSVANWTDADPSKAITRVQYAAHSWNAQYDCYLGECPFEVDETGMRRLVAFAGLYSHAMYPQVSTFQLYEKVSASLLMNVDGVYIGDRTAKGGPIFLPTANNTLFLPMLNNLTREQATGEFSWAAWSGSWGGYLIMEGKGSPNVALTCFTNNFTTQGTCPAGNPATSYIDFFLSKKFTLTTIENFPWMTVVNSPFTVDPITGPLMRTFTYTWEGEGQAPVWAKQEPGTNVSCPFSGDPSLATPYDTNYSTPNLVGFILALAGLLIGTGVLFCVAMCWPRLGTTHELKAMVEKLALRNMDGSAANVPPELEGSVVSHSDCKNDSTTFYAWRSLVWMGLALAVYITGVVLSVLGIQDVFTAFNSIYNLAVYEQLENAFKAVLIIFGSWQILVFIVALFVRSEDIVRLLCCNSPNPLAGCRGVDRCGSYMHTVAAGVLVIAINTTMLLFAFGFMVTIVGMLFQLSCNAVLQHLFDGNDLGFVCINLEPIGIDRIICGADLTKTCGIWEGLHVSYVCFGSLLLMLSHLLMFAMTVHQFVSLRSSWLLSQWLRSGTWKHVSRVGSLFSGASKSHQKPPANGSVTHDHANPAYGASATSAPLSQVVQAQATMQ